ncbi:UNVERIFIED_CONTAM: hypothetical protein Slati_1711200 [Sesamum latifolium]|uniref:RNase H type-1 domain-containing protein n=1 Tax=Sesamum latifolium TaxID=2727402 RepID=A0AAW2WWM1_9LAMI
MISHRISGRIPRAHPLEPVLLLYGLLRFWFLFIASVAFLLLGRSLEPWAAFNIFLYCHYSRQVWALSNLPWSILHVSTSDPLLWIKHIATSLPHCAFAEFLVFCWYIWWSRNRLCMENISLSPMQTSISASSFINSYRDATASPAEARITERASCWSCPPSGFIKLNFDGALFPNGVDVSLGVVARDETGTVIAWMSLMFPRKAEAEHIEALAARAAAELANSFGWPRVILEGDCLNLIRKLNTPAPNLSNIVLLCPTSNPI